MTTSKTGEKPEHRLLGTHTGYAGWAKILIATIRLADGHTVEREIEDHGEAICVLPYNAARRTAILVRQLRAPTLDANSVGRIAHAFGIDATPSHGDTGWTVTDDTMAGRRDPFVLATGRSRGAIFRRY